MKKFYAVIGNPPYQEEVEGTSDRPIYNDFMDAAYAVSDKVELITPARFLFNAGKTPKAWNKKMLEDEHLKVIDYHQRSNDVFGDTDIKGGVVVTYRDETANFGPIGVFSAFDEINSIVKKVSLSKGFNSLRQIVYTSDAYQFTPEFHSDFPNAKSKLSKDHQNDLVTSIFDNLPDVFHDEGDTKDVLVYGRQAGMRVLKYIEARYLSTRVPNFKKFKVFVPKSNGSGALGEVLSTPLIGQPLIGHTQTFISIGNFNTEEEAHACLKYIKSKFARALLGVLKVTQHNPASTWAKVPLQNFTSDSDIDWTQSVAAIDRQLYRKYDLSEEEIAFIETHVKEMS